MISHNQWWWRVYWLKFKNLNFKLKECLNLNLKKDELKDGFVNISLDFNWYIWIWIKQSLI